MDKATPQVENSFHQIIIYCFWHQGAFHQLSCFSDRSQNQPLDVGFYGHFFHNHIYGIPTQGKKEKSLPPHIQ
jgi:hypothetical protein